MTRAFPCLETRSFLAYIADNTPLGIHRRGYNGVAALIPRHSGNNLFVPTYAGLNYETISLSGMPTYRHEPTKHDHQSKFEPRCEPMQIESADADQVVLVQPETEHSGVGARITFTAEEPHYLHQRIELSFHKRFCDPGEPSAFSSLWASYMHTPPDRHIYLKADWQADGRADWFGLTKADHTSSEYRSRHLPDDRDLGAGAHLEEMERQPLLEELPPGLIDGPLTFYYGFCHGEQLVLMMFKQSERFRLAYSPSGGGQEPDWSPAWDYVLRLDDAPPGSTHVWDLCMVVKEYRGQADILEEVRRYVED